MKGDFIVRVWVPLDVRIEGMGTAESSEIVADDYMRLQDPLTGLPALNDLREAIEPTAFYLKADEIRYESKPATD